MPMCEPAPEQARRAEDTDQRWGMCWVNRHLPSPTNSSFSRPGPTSGVSERRTMTRSGSASCGGYLSVSPPFPSPAPASSSGPCPCPWFVLVVRLARGPLHPESCCRTSDSSMWTRLLVPTSRTPSCSRTLPAKSSSSFTPPAAVMTPPATPPSGAASTR
eukprot:3941527-Rhodomonas_salina.2